MTPGDTPPLQYSWQWSRTMAMPALRAAAHGKWPLDTTLLWGLRRHSRGRCVVAGGLRGATAVLLMSWGEWQRMGDAATVQPFR